jgi:hypothetical protein
MPAFDYMYIGQNYPGKIFFTHPGFCATEKNKGQRHDDQHLSYIETFFYPWFNSNQAVSPPFLFIFSIKRKIFQFFALLAKEFAILAFLKIRIKYLHPKVSKGITNPKIE